MRYGQPSIETALKELIQKGVTDVVVLPLYPQWAASSTQSSIEEVKRAANDLVGGPQLSFIESFYDNEDFIDGFVSNGQKVFSNFDPDHVLFSFHGLPESHIMATDRSGTYCFQKPNCCEVIGSQNRYCYRAHCVQTANAIAKKMNIDVSRYSITFQSRLGREKWIEPYTDIVIPNLAEKGIKKLAVFSPSFVADCLETLEEIGIRAKEQFIEHGGQQLELIASLNADPNWARGVAKMVLAKET